MNPETKKWSIYHRSLIEISPNLWFDISLDIARTSTNFVGFQLKQKRCFASSSIFVTTVRYFFFIVQLELKNLSLLSNKNKSVWLSIYRQVTTKIPPPEQPHSREQPT